MRSRGWESSTVPPRLVTASFSHEGKALPLLFARAPTHTHKHTCRGSATREKIHTFIIHAKVGDECNQNKSRFAQQTHCPSRSAASSVITALAVSAGGVSLKPCPALTHDGVGCMGLTLTTRVGACTLANVCTAQDLNAKGFASSTNRLTWPVCRPQVHPWPFCRCCGVAKLIQLISLWIQIQTNE